MPGNVCRLKRRACGCSRDGGMRVFLDTNILLDVLMNRPSFFTDSEAVVLRCKALGAGMFVVWHGPLPFATRTNRAGGHAGGGSHPRLGAGGTHGRYFHVMPKTSEYGPRKRSPLK